ncbi:hypothetical protein [Streptomyces phaeoluteigriseus]
MIGEVRATGRPIAHVAKDLGIHKEGRVDPVRRVLDLSTSTYFARKKRPEPTRRLRDEQLMPLIVQGPCGIGRLPVRQPRRRGLAAAPHYGAVFSAASRTAGSTRRANRRAP